MLRNAVKRLLGHTNIAVIRRDSLERLIQLAHSSQRREDDLKFLSRFCVPQRTDEVLGAILASRAQIRQDVFALLQTGFKRGGFFVEFGAAGGVEGSNTYLLETQFGWSGIVAEPSRHWIHELRRNRRCVIENDCVWRETGSELEFTEVGSGYESGISMKLSKDRVSGDSKITYRVNTISLVDMLKKHRAPRHIDYLSIDTEGSEFDILQAFDFSSHSFSLITCEHNRTPNRERVRDLLGGNGYSRVETPWGFEDWFVPEHEAP